VHCPAQKGHRPVKREALMIVVVLLVVGIAVAFRMPRLGVRPMHADEAVQAARFRNLWQQGRYVYDPDEFHGPTLMYATYPSVWLSGVTRFADTTKSTYRAVPVVFGCMLVLLILTLGGPLGRSAAIWAALLVAVSPAMVFYSRYYIHETLLVFFTLAAIACAWRYVQWPRLRWAAATGVCIGLMQATKETATIAYLGAGLAVAATGTWSFLGGRFVRSDEGSAQAVVPANRLARRRFWLHGTVALLLAVAVSGILLSSFLTNPRGLLDGILTYLPWLHRAGGASPHVHPWYFYVHRLGWWRLEGGRPWSEALIGVLGAIGLVVGMRRREGGAGDLQVGFTRWLGCYTLAVTGLYSVIPYKTPWCLLQFWIGWVLLAGIGAAAMVQRRRSSTVRVIVTAVLLCGAGDLGWQAYQESFRMPADVRNPYVYAQTSPGAEKLANQLNQLALASADGADTQIQVIWHDAYYWPLPWYLRRWENAEFWTDMPPDPHAPIIVASPQYDAQLTARLGRDYLMTDYYQLRPRVLVQLWVRFELWEAHLKRLGRI